MSRLALVALAMVGCSHTVGGCGHAVGGCGRTKGDRGRGIGGRIRDVGGRGRDVGCRGRDLAGFCSDVGSLCLSVASCSCVVGGDWGVRTTGGQCRGDQDGSWEGRGRCGGQPRQLLVESGPQQGWQESRQRWPGPQQDRSGSGLPDRSCCGELRHGPWQGRRCQ
jgi:hypothetical protein